MEPDIIQPPPSAPSKPPDLNRLARCIGDMWVVAGTTALFVLIAERGLGHVYASLGPILTGLLVALVIGGAGLIIARIMMYLEGSKS